MRVTPRPQSTGSFALSLSKGSAPPNELPRRERTGHEGDSPAAGTQERGNTPVVPAQAEDPEGEVTGGAPINPLSLDGRGPG